MPRFRTMRSSIVPLAEVPGKEELAAFPKACEPIAHGVRHNCNHVIDAGPGGGIVVTYCILLIRIAPSSEASKLKSASMEIMEHDEHLPKLISYAMVTDRLTRTDAGDWRVRHKRVENGLRGHRRFIYREAMKISSLFHRQFPKEARNEKS
ncbi:hypothetical protein PY650_21120 [Rhizobium calliandrae]|uniref:Uncharacterized protein n=1 Tax=Rhizobium calliandrae TaxID=1312182 RepID=A0ABT7KJH8_9HYPH|nr:hypothetical protein [Rhizobium calliandrae]MDL2408108.1 hypothetical protein [Rhizobium calliandrae]